MKNRSHRLPTSDPPDDWVDGSWTVDCVCGVNFDDGEEMVNCDECGVWVHTRCSRYVKSEKSFACDKCKNRNARNDSEETEVAQLLVELPTKTLRMESPYPSSVPPRRPFRLWTDIPIEERVHVQGVPGGEPAIVGGLSAIFTPELWKCTGYVPKRFNFQYREFPCWEEKPGANTKPEEENENPVDKGAGVLFSLSKENVLFAPPATSISVRQVDESGQESLVPPKDAKKWECENIGVSCGQESMAKDAVLAIPVVSHCSKRKQEDSVAAKDARKKGKVAEREKESKKRALQAPKTACTLSSDAKKLDFYEDRGSKSVKTDTHLDPRSSLLGDPSLGGHQMLENNVNKPKDDLALNEHHSVALASDACGHNVSAGARLLKGKDDHQVSTRTENSGADNGMALSMECNHPGSVPIKEEDVGLAPDTLTDDLGGPSVNAGIDPHTSEPNLEDSIAAVVNDNESCQDPSAYPCLNSVEPCARVKTEADLDKSQGTFGGKSSALSDIKLNGTKLMTPQPGASTDHLSANVKMNDITVISLQTSDPKVQGVDRSAEAVTVCQIDTASISPYDPNQNKQQSDELEGSTAKRKSSSELKHDLRASDQPSKFSRIVASPAAAAASERKLVTSVGKISSASSDNFISKPSASDNCKPSNVQSSNSAKKWGTPDSNINTKKASNSNDVVRREEKHELPRKVLKDRSKSAVSSVLKASHYSKTSHASDPKRTVSDLKHSVLHSSSKASSTQNVGVTSGCGESASSLQSQSASHVQNKISGSGLPQKGEKVNQSNSHLSTKVNHMVPMHNAAPSNGPATLSDEELALLLHQELNSSPRVPRVPRLRHTGSLPQIASPTATSILIKRTSSSGGSNHSTVARRKNKDSAKDGSRNSREVDDEAKMGKLPPSPDQKRHDSACTLDSFTKRESDTGSGKGLHAIKKSVPSVSTATVSSGLSSSTEANEQNMSSMCNSLRNASDDDTGAVGGSTPRTLPGLIAEIMSKGKHMSYEELCNAVLPHWPNLRKHNGERYAYSSHSQAVLDCLRNRHEWAQLVDRGPKTGASRKRRRLDAESPTLESEDNLYGKDAIKDVESKSFESHREDFPKGKRKARKRRRLALQGRGIKDVRRRRKADELSDEDVGSFFSSSEESMFSDEEIQGGEATLDGSEASSSADEMGAS
ncbi:hypothetical protein NMG60_11026865 [Bertholletia excelsa]